MSSAFDAIIEVGGTQQLVSTGRFYSCNSLNLEAGTKVNFERVLAVKDGEDLKVGQPYVKGVTVQATVMEAYRGKKEIVYKMKPKKHYRKKTVGSTDLVFLSHHQLCHAPDHAYALSWVKPIFTVTRVLTLQDN